MLVANDAWLPIQPRNNWARGFCGKIAGPAHERQRGADSINRRRGLCNRAGTALGEAIPSPIAGRTDRSHCHDARAAIPPREGRALLLEELDLDTDVAGSVWWSEGRGDGWTHTDVTRQHC